MLRQAEEKLRAGRLDQAADLFLAVVDEDSDDALAVEAFVGLARASLFLGMVPEAENYASAAAEVDPKRADVQTVWGLIHETKDEVAQL